MENAIAKKSANYWIKKFHKLNIACSKTNTIDEITKDIDTLFVPGLNDGLIYYDRVLSDMEKELAEEMEIFSSESWKTDAGAKHLMGDAWVQKRKEHITASN